MGINRGGNRRANRITHRSHRVDERRREAGVHFLSEAGDEDLHRPRVVLVIALPDAFAQLGAGKNASGLLHQNLQYIKLPRRQRHNAGV